MLKRNKILTLFLFVQIILVNWLSRYPEFIEKYYSNGIYPPISSFFRTILGWLPFSFGDILLIIAFILILRSIWLFLKNKKNLTNTFFSIGAKLSILYFAFYLFWGMNYYRKPLQESMKLEIPEYNIEDLAILTENLLVKTQEIHFKLTKNDTIPVQTVLTETGLLDRTYIGYENLSKKYPQFTYIKPKVKKSIFSIPMSYMGFAGYLNPLTGEAHVNSNLVTYTVPATASHEVAHQIGYANESEANFIGYLAAINNTDILFQYSARIMALRYALYEIRRNDMPLYKEISARIPIGVQKNIEENLKHWKKYDSALNPIFHKIYDTFLKANKQKHGMKSYGKMVGLLMAYENR